MVKKITQEFGGVPVFMVRLIGELVGKVTTMERRVDVAVQTDVNCL